MKLLNAGNAKTRKGEKLGFITFGIHLAPYTLSGFNVCSCASDGCAAACLNTAGRGAMTSVQKARIDKTKFFFENKKGFLAQLHKEITAAIKSAARKNLTPCFRLNLTSDLPWESIKHEGKSMMEHFPNVQFYDYTKMPQRISRMVDGIAWPQNYHLTFSRSEESNNQKLSLSFLQSSVNVAAVFRGKLPKTWKGAKVIDGDESDVRFLDPKGCIVGLVEKGLAKKDETGFVIEPS